MNMPSGPIDPFPSAVRYALSPSALDLLTQMLQHDRHARPTIKEALKHKFNNDGYDLEKACRGVKVLMGSEILRWRCP